MQHCTRILNLNHILQLFMNKNNDGLTMTLPPRNSYQNDPLSLPPPPFQSLPRHHHLSIFKNFFVVNRTTDDYSHHGWLSHGCASLSGVLGPHAVSILSCQHHHDHDIRNGNSYLADMRNLDFVWVRINAFIRPSSPESFDKLVRP